MNAKAAPTNLHMAAMPTKHHQICASGDASLTFVYVCGCVCVCAAAAAAAAAGWKYHRALRSLGQTLNGSPGEGLAFICRWVELLELREEKLWICACM